MKKTLFDLWNGNLCPLKESGSIPEIKELEKLIDSNSEKLLSSLNKKQSDIFESYNLCVEEYIMHTNEEAFYSGISLGIKIIFEALY